MSRKKAGKKSGTPVLFMAGRINELRTNLGLSQAALAEKLDVSTETISRFERGVVMPSLKTLFRLAKILGTSPRSLVAEAGSTSHDDSVLLKDPGNENWSLSRNWLRKINNLLKDRSPAELKQVHSILLNIFSLGNDKPR